MYDKVVAYLSNKEIYVRDSFACADENYKLKLIDDIPEDEVIALYHHNEYIDMCRGPHLINTKFLKYFKLMKISGSYWRGNSNNQTLQRIYGTAWEKKSSLDNYLLKLEEAEKRDHRKLGQKLDFFHFQEEAPGMVFWHDNGWTLFNIVKDFITEYLKNNEYKIIVAPGPNEIKEAKEIDALCILDNGKALDISQLSSLIKESSFVIANDTGPAHMAAHLNSKGLTLFGSHTTAYKVSIERENFTAIEVTDLNNLSAEKIFERLSNSFKNFFST